jgi:hypothetical protein
MPLKGSLTVQCSTPVVPNDVMQCSINVMIYMIEVHATGHTPRHGRGIRQGNSAAGRMWRQQKIAAIEQRARVTVTVAVRRPTGRPFPARRVQVIP